MNCTPSAQLWDGVVSLSLSHLITFHLKTFQRSTWMPPWRGRLQATPAQKHGPVFLYFCPLWFDLLLKSSPFTSFFSLPPQSLGVSGVYGRWRGTAGARPAQNTGKVIQFGVGSKLFGHLRPAWHGGAQDRADAYLSLTVLLTRHRDTPGLHFYFFHLKLLQGFPQPGHQASTSWWFIKTFDTRSFTNPSTTPQDASPGLANWTAYKPFLLPV